jgi:hypothetical protein
MPYLIELSKNRSTMRDRFVTPNGSLSAPKGGTASRLFYAVAATFAVLAMVACSGGWGSLPEVVQGPANQTVISGQTATFSVTATGTAPLSYQWFEGGVVLKGATGVSYTTPETTGDENGSIFSVTVTNAAGSGASASAMLTVEVPPAIVTPPVNRTVIAGQTATFSVTATGTALLSYQWLRGGSAIAGATSSSYTTPVTSGSDSGAVFSVTVSNMAGTVTTVVATLTVDVPPTVTLQPVSVRVDAGATATFSAAATGTAPMSYQWYRGGAAIPGANASSYTTAATAGSDDGAVFSVTVSNVAGTATSAVATLNVNVGPTITTQPVSQTLTAGQTATMSVTATGSHPMTYQWSVNGSTIGGATSNFYTTPALAGTNNGGLYTATVTNVAGTATSVAAVLTVNVPPTISAQPVSETVDAGATATFNVVAAGTAPLSYQWYRSGVAIPGAAASSYTTAATAGSDNGAVFTVTVTNVAGMVTSAAATLTVNVGPAITTQPLSQTVVVGQAATFFVAATGTAPLSYQWFKSGIVIAGASSRYYTTPAAVSGDSGSAFTVTVTNVAGSVTSAAAALTVNVPPAITAQPVSETVTAGQAGTFSVVATGTAPLTYQWFSSGSAIAGATSSSYATAATVSGDNGSVFTVTVTNVAGTVTSAAATLTVNTAPAITTQPVSETVTAGQTATFSVAATGSHPMTYQWYVNGAAIGGATANFYTTTTLSGTNNGALYTVTVTNVAGSVTSLVATLTVNVAPTISAQPVSETVTVGQTATFSVVAAGTAPLTYQWYSSGSPIAGATSSSYTTAATASGDSGSSFTVTVTNLVGSVTSSAAVLTVNAPPAITTQPLSQTVVVGQTATFFVATTGTAPLSYQWFKSGIAIAGASSRYYTTPATVSGDSGSAFTVTVTNVAGSVTSSAAALTVNSPPAITTQPVSETVTAGQTATFSVVATGTAPLTYQWYRNGAAIGGAASSSYTSSATVSGDSGALFTVTVTNVVGSITSSTAALTVNVPPAITTQPVGQTVLAGQTATFFAAATGTAPLSYQWYKSGIAIAGATSSSYTTPATASGDNGSLFTVTVTNVAGTVTSVPAALTVNSPPTITTQPASQTVLSGQTASFVVAATGTAPLTYQWYRSGVAVVGATSSSYTTAATVNGDSGATFTVTVTNVAGSVTSVVATLTVNTAPSITTQPASQTVVVGQTATFSVVATGTAPLTYQWYNGGIAIVGATSRSYTTAATVSGNSGSAYTVTVTNVAGSVTSAAAVLTVNSLPAITTQPVSQTVTSGQTASFVVVATGTAPLSYQWFRNGAAIAGATSSSYTTAATVSGDSGALFTVTITNTAGSVTSATATLTVNTAPTILAQPVSQAVTSPQTATFSVAASGSGTLTYQWYKNGSLISGATSSSYTTPATTGANNGSLYTVTVTNATGSVTSAAATLSVDTTPLANGLSCSSATPPYNSTITVVPNFSGGTAVIGTAGFGSLNVAASAVSGNVYTSAALTSATTFTLTVNGTGGTAAATTCTATPTSVTITPITPAAQTIAPGTQTFGATVTGGVTDNITWTATGGSFSGNVWTSPNTAGSYTITATSVDNTAVHVTTTVTVSAPVIAAQPVSQNACSGYSPSLTIGANYASSYQWYFNSSAIGGNSSALTFPDVKTTSNGNYSCVVTNGVGSVTSNTVTLNVVSPTTLTITREPSSVSVYATQTATFAVAAGGTGTLAYQWYTGIAGSGTIISGATASTYTTGALTTTNSGTTYYVTVTDPNCTNTTVTSTAATVTVSGTDTAVPPTIVVQPTGQTATVGGAATFTVTASGTGTLSYQWYRVAYSSTEVSIPTAGVLISNATSSSYTVPSSETTQSNDGDNYYVVVMNQYGTAVSSRVVLAVGAGIVLQIIAEPQTDYVGANALASFSTTATCTGCIPAYQWYWYAPGSTTVTALSNGALSSGTLSGATVEGATTSSITLENAPTTASGAVFYVIVTSTSNGTTQISGTNSLTSSTAGLFVGSLGAIGNTTAGDGLCNSTSANWVLNGTTPGTSNGDVPYQNTSACTMELTNDEGTEHAAVYWPTLISTAKFTVSFTVAISATNGNPADGFTMVLANPSQGATTASLGGTGEGMGADGIPGFVLGFDTFQNGNAQGDPGCMYNTVVPCDPTAVPYMAVGQGATNLWENPWTFVNGNLNTQSSTDYSASTFANATHSYVVTVVNSIMTVTMDGFELFTGTVSLPPAAYLGFTASTGGSMESVTVSALTATVSAP